MSGRLARWIETYREIKRLGPAFARARFSDRQGGGEAEVQVGPYGRVRYRRGDTDLTTLRQVFLNQEYAFPEMVRERVAARYAALLAAGRTPVIVDAGANIGGATIWFKHHFPRAAIVAVEPAPGNADVLRRNTARLDGVTVLEAAIGSEAGFAAVQENEGSWAFRTTRSTEGQAIVTVAQAAAGVPGGALFIVKVDIEGFESDLFAGNLGWLDEAYAVFVEPHDWMLPGRRTSGSFQRAMGEREFELFLVGENLAYVRV